MTQAAWILEGCAVGDGDEVLNSVADRIIKMQATSNKIDGAAALGLGGVEDSLSYEIAEVEYHFHNKERWFGKLAVQTATDWAENNLSPFRAISGNNAYGTDANDEAKVLGTADTPAIDAVDVKYDPHRIFVSAASSSTPYKVQVIWGSGTMAAAIAANQFSTTMIVFGTGAAANHFAPLEIKTPRLRCGVDQLWVRVWNATDNATFDFFIGLHEYSG